MMLGEGPTSGSGNYKGVVVKKRSLAVFASVVVAGVASVGAYTINSGTSDLTANQKQIVRAGTVTVA